MLVVFFSLNEWETNMNWEDSLWLLRLKLINPYFQTKQKNPSINQIHPVIILILILLNKFFFALRNVRTKYYFIYLVIINKHLLVIILKNKNKHRSRSNWEYLVSLTQNKNLPSLYTISNLTATDVCLYDIDLNTDQSSLSDPPHHIPFIYFLFQLSIV